MGLRVALCRGAAGSAIVLVGFTGAPRAAAAGELPATPETLPAVFAAADAGDVVRLAPGDYGTFAGGVKDGTVTVAAAKGALATMAVDLVGARGIRFEGLTLTSTDVRDSRDVEFEGNRFTGTATVSVAAGMADTGILFEGNAFDGIDRCEQCHEGRLTVRGDMGTAPAGVTIARNHFGGGGESDGVQVIGSAYGVEIVANEFEGLHQLESYEAHVDPIQLYGSSHTLISHNYFHDNETGIMAPDGADHERIEQNVFVSSPDGYPWPIVLGSDDGSAVVHNTLVDAPCWGIRCGTLRLDEGNAGRPSTGTVVRDNVLGALVVAPSTTPAIEDHNLVAAGGGGGLHDLEGAATFAAGTAPADWAGHRLAPGSLGTGAASDGTDIGITAAAPPTPTPTPAPAAVATPTGRTVLAGAAPRLRVRLVRPRRGGRLGRRVRLVARVTAGTAPVQRVDFWVDGRRVARDGSAPYARTRALGRRLRQGRTVTARAFAADGAAASAAVAGAWRLSTEPAAGGTLVRAHGPRRRRVRVSLVRCDAAGPVALRLTLDSGAGGRRTASLSRLGLCVVRARALPR